MASAPTAERRASLRGWAWPACASILDNGNANAGTLMLAVMRTCRSTTA